MISLCQISSVKGKKKKPTKQKENADSPASLPCLI